MPTLNEFLGFYFNGHHTSEFNLYSTSGGDKYSRPLFGEIEEITETIPGRDGEFLFNTIVRTREMEITLSTESLTELQYRQVKAWLDPKITAKILFDEEPYKYYMVKLSGAPKFEFVPFDDGAGGTIYKGDISCTFVARDPYGYADYMSITDYQNNTHPAYATNHIWGPVACINALGVATGTLTGYKTNNVYKINNVSLAAESVNNYSVSIPYGGTMKYAPTIILDGNWEDIIIETNTPNYTNTSIQVISDVAAHKNTVIYQNNGYCMTNNSLVSYYQDALYFNATNAISNTNTPINIGIKIRNLHETNVATFNLYFLYTYKYW